jgi:ATP-binding cassette subfamily B protein
VKLFGIENVFSRMSNFLYGSFQDSIYKLQLTSGKYNLLAGLSGVIVITSVIATASFEVLNNNLKIGELTAIIGLASGFIAAVSNLALTNIRLREARVAFDRMYEFAGLDPEFKEETINTELPKIDSIVLNNLSFRFPGKSKLINNINIEIKKGEIICLFGEIGCGKSTILNIISRMYSGYEGQILIDSEDWNRYSIPVWRSMIASVPQYTELFNSTVFENISFKLSSQKDIENVEKFCKENGFHEWFNALPQGYNTILGQSGSVISGGQRQMVALARALYSAPQFLLLDEPSSGMDRKSEQFVMDLLKKSKKDIGIVLVTHKVELARQADRIYVVEKGTLTAAGKHNEICNGNSIYSAIYNDLRTIIN